MVPYPKARSDAVGAYSGRFEGVAPSNPVATLPDTAIIRPDGTPTNFQYLKHNTFLLELLTQILWLFMLSFNLIKYPTVFLALTKI
jgi:hypothetical protein